MNKKVSSESVVKDIRRRTRSSHIPRSTFLPKYPALGFHTRKSLTIN